MHYRRNITKFLKEALMASPVVLLVGARQTGKSTLMEEMAQELKATYLTFDDVGILAGAMSDPIGFLADQPKPLILDEIQRVPELFVSIKRDVDRNRHPGRYALTGSANPLMLPRVSDSLAGRMEILELWPLSMGELIGHEETFITSLFAKTFSHITYDMPSRQELMKRLIQGGYPSMQGQQTAKRREAWCQSYINTLLMRDVQELAHIERLAALPNLLSLLASRPGCLLNVAELSRSAGIPVATLHRYIQLFHTLFIIHFQPAWSKNLGKRLTKSPKIYFADTGLLTHLLGADEDYLLSHRPLAGHVLENFVVSELQKQATWSSLRVRQYHLRSANGDEVDIVLETLQGKVAGIEIKSSDSVHEDDFKGLKYLQNALGNSFVRGVVFYLGSQRIAFGDNLYAIPLSALWQTSLK